MLQLNGRAQRFTPAGAHCFFGYYDIPAFRADQAQHLYLRVPFMDRMQELGDVADLWVHDFHTGKDNKFAETTAWNFQQGCMLQWHPTRENTVIYNVRADTPCGYGAAIHDLDTGHIQRLDRPVAHVASTGKRAVSINFDRMFDFRPGYGYAGRRDDFYGENHPDADGIFLIDLETGQSQLIASLARIWDFCGKQHFGIDQKIMINHITFNPSGERIVFLVRNFYAPGGAWESAILTCDCSGELFLLSDFAMASHYHWKNDDTLAFYSDGREVSNQGAQLYELEDRTHAGRAIDPAFFQRDGHCSYAPDGEFMLYDSYIFPDFTRQLYLYNLRTKKGGLLGIYAVPACCQGDIRCDLHPVWAPDSHTISFDSVHEGFRGVYRMDLTEARAALR
ncbi:MAG: hypothetical protein ACOYI5_11110 [Christensenellales bacterium]|jgi:hypothetical protein